MLIYAKTKAEMRRWEQEVCKKYQKSLISPLEVSRQQEDFILCFSFYDLNELPTLRPKDGSLYIYSSHEAFEEEQLFDFRRLLNWLDYYRIRPLGVPRPQSQGLHQVPEEERGYHSSGHASGEELIDMVREIQPQVLIPVHCTPEGHRFFQEHLKGTGISVKVPEYGKPIPL